MIAMSSHGFDVKQRLNLDSSIAMTMVDTRPFLQEVVIDTVELFAAVSERPLVIGIYRADAGGICSFQLVQQIELASFKKGYNKVTKSSNIFF